MADDYAAARAGVRFFVQGIPLLFQPLFQYACFHGRTGRKAFWLGQLGLWLAFIITLPIGGFLLSLLGHMTGLDTRLPMAAFFLMLWLGLLVPTLALYARRLHDMGLAALPLWVLALPAIGAAYVLFTHTHLPLTKEMVIDAGTKILLLVGGVYMPLKIIFLAAFCTDSTHGPNRFGADPKNRPPATTIANNTALQWAALPLKKYFQFKGRSTRKEFWFFALGLLIVSTMLQIGGGTVDNILGLRHVTIEQVAGSVTLRHTTSPIMHTVKWALAALFIVPNLAAGARRLHDTARSGWWLLLNLIPFVGSIALMVFLCLDGTCGPNPYGPDPKGRMPAHPTA